MEAGATAPFDGDLYPVIRSLRLISRVELCEEKSAENVAHAKRVFDLELRRVSEKADNKAEADQLRIDLLQGRLDASSSWYREPWFVASVTALVTTLAIIGAILLARETLFLVEAR